jgi:hypothetical protein
MNFSTKGGLVLAVIGALLYVFNIVRNAFFTEQVTTDTKKEVVVTTAIDSEAEAVADDKAKLKEATDAFNSRSTK